MSERNRILDKMVDRLYASLATGPVLSCRPHSSRQRIDLMQVAKLAGGGAAASDAGTGAATILRELLGEARQVKLSPPALPSAAPEADVARHEERQSVLGKLRTIAEDAKTYEQDTGAHVLYVGFPLLDLPPNSARGAGNSAGAAARVGRGFGGGDAFAKRILAPICFVPIQLAIRTTRPQSVTIECANEGNERVIPNAALLAWIEQTTGQTIELPSDDDEDTQTWREINHITQLVAKALGLDVPAELSPDGAIVATPKADEERTARVLPSAVLGLFPVTNQNLLRDLEALADGEVPDGPIQSFLRADHTLADEPPRPRDIRNERLVSHADPCQARAVRLAGTTRNLVVHGPPGTGKSQTIANIVGDHLARGQRVLFVCDKRTAIDVVEHRLSHLGLGHLCAVIHDVQRDQRELYKSVREQLEGLVDAKPDPNVAAMLARVDDELSRLHEELRGHDRAVAERDASGRSFHDIAGQWLAIDVPPEVDAIADVQSIDGVGLDQLLGLESDARDVLARAATDDAPTNPWLDATELPLATYLGKPVEHWKRVVAQAHEVADAADATSHSDVLPFDPALALAAQGEARAQLAERLTAATARLDAGAIAAWAARDAGALGKAIAGAAALEVQLAALEAVKPEPELALVIKTAQTADLLQWIGALASYLEVQDRWYRGFCFGRKGGAREVLTRFGLALDRANAERVHAYLCGVRARRVVDDWYGETIGGSTAGSDEIALAATVRAYATLWGALAELHEAGVLASIRPRVLAMLADAHEQARVLDGLRRSAARWPALGALETALDGELFAPAWRTAVLRDARAGERVAARLAALQARLGSLDGTLRMKRALGALPPAVARPLEALARGGIAADAGWCAIERGVLAAELARRLATNPALQSIDNDRMRTIHHRYRELEAQKRELVRRSIVSLWTTRQRERLLASTGSRLNAAGAELKRRLTLRGEKAMRIRQVITAGALTEGGDPLFDVRPVWMASPETVAQIFARKPVFDVVVFDEASQCRLEEALPVLVRAHRVVIAGDPMQLPPTRFFESAVARSDDADADLSEQSLFEDQQADVEDLLGAALNLEIEQCYLDVHYRSSNADLIEFSNRNFYEARLQPIPGHPKNRAVTAPLQLVRVDGVYDKRSNVLEARRVVEIVKELLARPNPPSVGIACFNLTQRDAIVEALDEAAAEDATFAARLATARTRKGAASFEGLFVKNLENVQGDERDHIIISTTYGPDPKGKFYRRFGPLLRAGGGRRLNVLVTRARTMVHLVTSIPQSEYVALPPIEAGRTPNGAWLLFSYLQYAEQLEKAYADEATERGATETMRAIRVLPTRAPSQLVASLAAKLADDKGLTSDVYWGNDGFCVDLALHHPTQADNVTIGVLCDGTRYTKVDDPIEWDLFRVHVLESQGWNLLRVWSPHLVRDRAALLDAIHKGAVRESGASASEPAPPPPSPPAKLPTARLLN